MWQELLNVCCNGNATKGLLILGSVGLLLVWLILLTFVTIKTYTINKRLVGNTGRDNLRDILQEHMGRVGSVQMRLNDIEKILSGVQTSGRSHIAKVAIVRFNPFDDTGGNQSFALALLDEKDDGVVISSLHARERTRVYAKPVKSGEATDFEFSKEESEAIQKALG